jgi:hypothetical protein
MLCISEKSHKISSKLKIRGARDQKVCPHIYPKSFYFQYWACGVVGSASALQAEGHRFDSGLVHYFF